MAVAAVVVIALFVLDPFGGDGAQTDGLHLENEDAPFIAVIEHNRAKSRTVDEPEEVLEVVIEAETAVEPATKATVDERTVNRGQRTAADE